MEGNAGITLDMDVRPLIHVLERSRFASRLRMIPSQESLGSLSIGLVVQLGLSCCLVLLLSKVVAEYYRWECSQLIVSGNLQSLPASVEQGPRAFPRQADDQMDDHQRTHGPS